MNEELISVIVPIYNVEKYLSQCLDSIITQTYTNIEIMLVDDGSPDNSGKICDEYVAKDVRIKVLHVPNGGVAKARQLGVENSNGEYIVFIDPDDWLPLDSIANLHSYIADDVDIVIGFPTNGYKKEKSKREIKTCNIDTNAYIIGLLDDTYTCNLWGKLYRRSIFSSNSFPSAVKGQDFLTNLELAMRVRVCKIAYIITYYYFSQRTTSTSNTIPVDLNIVKIQCNEVKSILSRSNEYEKYKIDYLRYRLRRLYKVIIQRGGYLDIKEPLVYDIYRSTSNINLTKKERLTRISLRFKLLQQLLCSYVAGKAKLKKFIRNVISR